MQVLQVHTPYRHFGGEDRVVGLEAELLRSSGHRVHQHLVGNPESVPRAAGLFAASSHNPLAARRAVDLARRLGVDVVHVHNTWFAQSPSVVRALSHSGFPVVVTMHNYRPMCIASTLHRDGRECTRCVGRGAWAGVVHGCYDTRPRSAVAAVTIGVHRGLGTWRNDAHVTLVLSQSAREMFVQDGFSPEHLIVKPNFTMDPGSRLRPPSASRTYLFVARLVGEKGPAFLLDAWEAAAIEGARLLIVGTGPAAAKLQVRTVPGAIWAGPRTPEQIRDLMMTSRALVFPSIWREPFGMSLVEAMAAGLPVVGSHVGAVPEILPPSSGDLLVQPHDVAGLAAAIRRLEDDRQVDVQGETCRRRYLEAYTPELNLTMLLAAYELAARFAQRRPQRGAPRGQRSAGMPSDPPRGPPNATLH